ncbi:hypothetical protein HNW77_08535 [Komagataeibacter sp. AV436]|uniref:Uncharacterized protein n=1 Tax=Komagataeibacter melomenusus TaxID=2766578 RepID=A0ABX2ADQ9_9PROT|nr:hypothetical protein [Komagataeibacter melomenusus]MBV1830778.1 hypothetical protein [Komagataeibacter melomenusus]NPC66435.1 hypothetical protein [Komagataeibacter melomenusus]
MPRHISPGSSSPWKRAIRLEGTANIAPLGIRQSDSHDCLLRYALLTPPDEDDLEALSLIGTELVCVCRAPTRPG